MKVTFLLTTCKVLIQITHVYRVATLHDDHGNECSESA